MFALPIDIQRALVQHTQSVSVPIRHPSDKSSAKSQASRHIHYIYTSQIQQDTRYIRGIFMRVASVGCFPEAWWRGSWHFQVASLHLQSSMDFSFSASHYFSLPGPRRSALYIHRTHILSTYSSGCLLYTSPSPRD